MVEKAIWGALALCHLFAHTGPAGVDRVVMIQMSYYQYDHAYDNAYLRDVIERYPGKFFGVAVADYDAADVGEARKNPADRCVPAIVLFKCSLLTTTKRRSPW